MEVNLDSSLANKSTNGISMREHWIDLLRSFTIIIVVIGHAVQFADPDFDDNIIFRYIYSFHMPLFMFLSGYTAFLSMKGGRVDMVGRFRTLLVPFLSWLAVYFSVTSVAATFRGDGANIDFLKFIIGVVKSPDNGGMWFLWVLFLNLTILYLAQRMSLILGALFVFLAIVAVNAFVLAYPDYSYLGLRLLRWHSVFFFAGYCFAVYRKHFRKYIEIIGPYSGFVFVILAFFWRRKDNPLFVELFPGLGKVKIFVLSTGFTFFVASMAIVFFVYLSGRLQNYSFVPLVNKIGVKSLQIYVTHLTLFALIPSVSNFAQISMGFTIMIDFIIIISLTAVFIRFVEKWGALEVLLYGRVSRKNFK